MVLRYNFGIIIDIMQKKNSENKDFDAFKEFPEFFFDVLEGDMLADSIYWSDKENGFKACGRRVINPSKDCYVTMDDLESYGGLNMEI